MSNIFLDNINFRKQNKIKYIKFILEKVNKKKNTYHSTNYFTNTNIFHYSNNSFNKKTLNAKINLNKKIVLNTDIKKTTSKVFLNIHKKKYS